MKYIVFSCGARINFVKKFGEKLTYFLKITFQLKEPQRILNINLSICVKQSGNLYLSQISESCIIYLFDLELI